MGPLAPFPAATSRDYRSGQVKVRVEVAIEAWLGVRVWLGVWVGGQVEDAEAVLIPQVQGRPFRVRGDVRRVIEDTGRPAARSVGRPAGVPVRGERRPLRAHQVPEPDRAGSGRRSPRT